MKILMTTVAVAAMAFVPATAQAQLFGGFDNGTLLGGAAGAGLGGVIGSNLAGSGRGDEGTAIGAVVGGLAGASFANQQSNFAGNPFAGQFNPGFTGRNLIGTGIGAGIGGAIGSNLAGSGVRQEGTAIGAVLGGAAGYALANRGSSFANQGSSRYGGVGPQGIIGSQGGFGPQGGFGGGFVPPTSGFVGGPGFMAAGFGAPAFGAPGFGAPVFSGPQFVPSGQFISGPVLPVTRFVQPAPRRVILSQPRTVFTAPVSTGITHSAPNVRLAGPPIRPTVVRRTVRVQAAPVVRSEHVIVEPANCPSGTTLQSDGSCLERTVSYVAPSPSYSAPAPVISQPYVAPQMADCPSGTTQQSDGTCLETNYSSSSFGGSSSFGSTSSSITLPDTMVFGSSSYSSSSQVVNCPSGTTKQSDGTCLAPGVTSYTPSYSSSPSVTTTYRAPTTYSVPATTHSVADTAVRTQDEYCYAGSSKRYDSLGKEIKTGNHNSCRQH